MADERIRRQIAFLAAQLMYERIESEYFTAKRKAAKQLGVEYATARRPPLQRAKSATRSRPSPASTRAPKRLENLRDMRLEALRLMRHAGPVPAAADRQRHDRPRPQGLRHRHPRLLRQPRPWSPTCSTSTGLQYDVERKQIVKHGEARMFTHIHVHDRFNFELTLYAEDKAHYVFKSSITGKAIERASIAELEEFLRRGIPRRSTSTRRSSGSRTTSTASRSSGCCSCRWRT